MIAPIGMTYGPSHAILQIRKIKQVRLAASGPEAIELLIFTLATKFKKPNTNKLPHS